MTCDDMWWQDEGEPPDLPGVAAETRRESGPQLSRAAAAVVGPAAHGARVAAGAAAVSLGALSECLGADPVGLVSDAPAGAGVVDMCFFLEGHCVRHFSA